MFEFLKSLFSKKEKPVKKLDLIDELIERSRKNPGYVPKKELREKCLTRLCKCVNTECEDENDEN